MLGMDLRTEPIVITVPQIEKNRYFSIQLVDLYTFNFDYIGTRTTGNEGGRLPRCRVRDTEIGRDARGREESHPFGDR